jgi:hypothetical protein
MLVDLVLVAAAGVRLPDLDERPAHRPSVLVGHAPAHEDPLADGLAVVLPRQVAVVLADCVLPEHGPVERVQLLGHRDERPLRRAQARRAVPRVVDLHLRPEVRVVGKDDVAHSPPRLGLPLVSIDRSA